VKSSVVTIALAGMLALTGPARAADAAPRIGWLNPGSPVVNRALATAFNEGLADRGYIDGRNIVVEYRWAKGKLDQLPELAAELVKSKPTLIVASGANAIQAVRDASATIPIVMATINRPLDLGFIASYAHPGGNITGMTNQSEDLIQKMLELIMAVNPKARRIGVLGNPDNPTMAGNWREMQDAARSLGVEVTLGEARQSDEIGAAFTTVLNNKPDLLLVLPDAMMVSHRQRVVERANRSGLPVIYPFRLFVNIGGLMSYGASLKDQFRRAAGYVDRILKGAKPGDLPVEQPTEFELVLNLKTAEALAIPIPQELLLRAEEVIR